MEGSLILEINSLKVMRSSPNFGVCMLSQYPAAKLLLITQIEIYSLIITWSKFSIILFSNLENKIIILQSKMSEC